MVMVSLILCIFCGVYQVYTEILVLQSSLLHWNLGPPPRKTQNHHFTTLYCKSHTKFLYQGRCKKSGCSKNAHGGKFKRCLQHCRGGCRGGQVSEIHEAYIHIIIYTIKQRTYCERSNCTNSVHTTCCLGFCTQHCGGKCGQFLK